jgi:signal transduction histidine kinase/phage shock protein PspC (stress-responsive transcriptional regulator)
MARGLSPRDHRGIAEAPESRTRPLPASGSPTEPLPVAPTAPLEPTLSEHGPGAAAASCDDPGRHWGRPGRRDWSAHEHRPHGHGPAVVGRKIRSLRRSPDNRVLGGVCGAVSRQTGIDVTWVRVGCVLACIFMGGMVLVYAVAWMMIPMEGQETTIFSRAVKDTHGLRLVVAVLLPVLVLTTVLTSTLHVPVVGFISWPTLIAVGLLVLIWRNANDSEKQFIDHEVVPLLGTDFHGRARHLLIIRIVAGVIVGGFGIALLVGGHTTIDALKPVGGAALVIAAAVIVFGPWWLSLVRDLIAERQARVRAEDRAQMAAHVHDSVLQTLALIQRSTDDPQNVLRLARAQERELRAWLFEGRSPGAISEDATMLGEGVNLLQRQVEADHGITVQVVVVGECDLDDALRALLDAAREATVNAAKWSGADQVSVFAEVEPDSVRVYVRDRGQGFDPASVPADRRGITQSIEARVARFGGEAVVRSAPGEGAEVQLFMPRRERVK